MTTTFKSKSKSKPASSIFVTHSKKNTSKHYKTTTLSPELTKIYSNFILYTLINRRHPLPKGSYDFPVAEKREDDLIEDFYEGYYLETYKICDNKERYRHFRALDFDFDLNVVVI